MITMVLLAPLALAAPAADGAFSPDGGWLAYQVDRRKPSVALVRTSDWTPALTLPCGCTEIDDLAFSPDGAMLAARTPEGPRLWRVADGALVPMSGIEAPHLPVAWLGPRLAVGQPEGLVLLDPTDGTVTSVAIGAPGVVRELQPHADGLFAVSRTDHSWVATGTTLTWLGPDGVARAVLDVSDDGAMRIGPGIDGWVVYKSARYGSRVRAARLEGGTIRRATLYSGPEDWLWVDEPIGGTAAGIVGLPMTRAIQPRFLEDRRLVQVGLGKDREPRLQWFPPSMTGPGGSVDLPEGAPLIAVAVTQVAGREVVYVATRRRPVVYETATMTRVWE